MFGYLIFIIEYRYTCVRAWFFRAKIYVFAFIFLRAVIGEIDDEIDSGIEMKTMKAEPFNPVVYWN